MPGQRAAARKLRALKRLRAALDVDAWQLDTAARHVVERHWARYVGLEVYRAHQSARAVEHKREAAKRKPAHRLRKREQLAGE